MAIIATGKLIKIRDITIEDVPQFVNWWNNGELMADVGFNKGLGITEDKLLKDFSKEISDPNAYRESRRYVVLDIKDNRPIGELAYGQLDLIQKKCGIGIKICELSYQGKGYGQDTLITFMNYLYNHFGLQKIEIDTLADNLRALSLYKKIGFKQTRIERDYWTDPEGISHDLIFMELYKNDWKY